MLSGTSQLSLDQKGRLAIPAKYRDGLLQAEKGKVICTIDTQSPCLLLYPDSAWQVILQKLSVLPTMNPNARALQRQIVGNAQEFELDNHCRILLPQYLRDYAGLDKKIVLVGQINKFELWDEQRWNEQRERELALIHSKDFELNEQLLDLSL